MDKQVSEHELVQKHIYLLSKSPQNKVGGCNLCHQPLAKFDLEYINGDVLYREWYELVNEHFAVHHNMIYKEVFLDLAHQFYAEKLSDYLCAILL